MKKTNGSGDSLYNDKQQQEIVEIGMKAAEALNNPILMIEFQILRARWHGQIDQGDNDAKELLKLQDKLQVLNEIYTDFVSMKSHAERILEERQKMNSPEYREQQRLDEQGFNLNFGQ